MSVKSGMAGGNMYSLKWNHYNSFLTSGLAQLLIDDSENSMTDVNLACEGQFIQAHKLILSLCSPFFKQLFRVNRMEKSNYINVVLTGVKFKDLKNILNFIYNGEVNIGNAELNNFLKTAEILQIEGLAGGAENNQEENALTTDTAAVLTSQGSQAPMPRSATPNNGAPPNKRSRLSVSSNTILNSTNSASRLGTHPSQPSQHSTTSNMPKSSSSNVILSETVEIRNAPSVMASDPLEDDEGGSIDECGEEMINLDSMKAEPIAVYTISDNSEGDAVDISSARNSTSRLHGSETDGISYDFEPHIVHASGSIGPGPSSSIVNRPRISTMPKTGKGAKDQRKLKSLRQTIMEYFHYNGLTRLSTCLIQNCASNISGKSPSVMKDHLVVCHLDVCETIAHEYGDEWFGSL
ncbi:unnamed protein product [Orchesella dallaii]|uniref:BTB domain-containing protein n=1 Tax=Orchesella dallaii TaxID=48710 RepID=A0ABP1QHX0_9HEXA